MAALIEQKSWGPVTGLRFGWSPFGVPNLCSHVFYVDGLLIDTGHSRMQVAIRDTLERFSIEQIAITHHHEDHTGNLAHLYQEYQCPVLASKECVELMKAPPPISAIQWFYWGSRPTFEQFSSYSASIVTSNYAFELVPIPGHAFDMVALFEPNEGWLFTADLYVHHHINYMIANESVAQQISSIKRVLELRFTHFFCSHNSKMRLERSFLQKKLIFLENYYERVATAYGQGKPAGVIMKELKLKEDWFMRIASQGNLSQKNMIEAVIRDEQNRVADLG